MTTTVDGLAELFGYPDSMLLLLDEEGTGLYTIASRGYEVEGVGSEIPIGAGVIGMAAAQCAPIRLGNLSQLKPLRTDRSTCVRGQRAISPPDMRSPSLASPGRKVGWRCRP